MSPLEPKILAAGPPGSPAPTRPLPGAGPLPAHEPPAIRLLAPGYRRWLTPDYAELWIEITGVPRERLSELLVRRLVTDGETDQLSQRAFVFDHLAPRLAMPAPKLHSRGEMVLALEDRRTGELLAQDRWLLRSIDPEQATHLHYFDSRPIWMSAAQAQFPLLWLPPIDAKSAHPEELATKLPALAHWQMLAPLGITAVGLPVAVERLQTDPTTGTAILTQLQELGMVGGKAVLQFTEFPESDRVASLTAVMAFVQQCRALPALFAYVLTDTAVTASTWPSWMLDCYKQVRQTDPNRPILWQVLAGSPKPALPADFQDVAILLATPQQSATALVAQSRHEGRPVLTGVTGIDWTTETLRATLYSQLASANSGFVFALSANQLLAEPFPQLLRELKILQPILCRAVPIGPPLAPIGSVPGQIRVWQRRFDEDFLILATYDGKAPLRAAFSIQPNLTILTVLGEGRQIQLQQGFLSDQFAAQGFHLYTTNQELAAHFPAFE